MKYKIDISFIDKKYTLVIFCVLFVFFSNLRLSYSQNIVPNPSYCNSDPPVTFRITAAPGPGGKTCLDSVYCTCQKSGCDDLVTQLTRGLHNFRLTMNDNEF